MARKINKRKKIQAAKRKAGLLAKPQAKPRPEFRAVSQPRADLFEEFYNFLLLSARSLKGRNYD